MGPASALNNAGQYAMNGPVIHGKLAGSSISDNPLIYFLRSWIIVYMSD